MEQYGQEVDTIPESVLRFWDQNYLKEYLFQAMENKLCVSNSELKHEGIIHLLIAM